MHKASRGLLKGAVSVQKALQGSEMETRDLLGEKKEKIVPRWGVIDLPSRQIKDFIQDGNRKNWVSGQTWAKWKAVLCEKEQHFKTFMMFFMIAIILTYQNFVLSWLIWMQTTFDVVVTNLLFLRWSPIFLRKHQLLDHIWLCWIKYRFPWPLLCQRKNLFEYVFSKRFTCKHIKKSLMGKLLSLLSDLTSP